MPAAFACEAMASATTVSRWGSRPELDAVGDCCAHCGWRPVGCNRW
ncbi:hypothetical protein [Streptomyces phaeofaciens]|nr:hypothetical protein [Streptomyces phaeofaciens]